jgi:hypothetical protein
MPHLLSSSAIVPRRRLFCHSSFFKKGITIQPPFAAAKSGLLMQAVRGASRLGRLIKRHGSCSKRKRFALQTTPFYEVLNNYKKGFILKMNPRITHAFST